MPLFLLIDSQGNAVRQVVSDANYAALNPHLLPLTGTPPPAFNPATHKLSQSFSINQGAASKTWSSIPLTATELEAISDSNERDALKAMINALKNGSGTDANRLLRVERVCVYLLKKMA